MAELGSVTLRAPATPLVADRNTIVRFVLAIVAQVVATRAPYVPSSAAHYRLAGTQNIGAGYVVPSRGQLWPRGARGEVSG